MEKRKIGLSKEMIQRCELFQKERQKLEREYELIYEANKNTGVLLAQPGFQHRFTSCSADIAIGGGSAGPGKSWSLLFDVARYTSVPGFDAVIFRRTTPQLKGGGSLWDKSTEIYNGVGDPTESSLLWKFQTGINKKTKKENKLATIKFSHLEYDKDYLSHQGREYAYIGFDEGSQFTANQFFKLMSRNRTMCGVSPCIRVTTNPDPDSFLAPFIEWWIDLETGYPIPERDGVIRYFSNQGGEIIWGDTIDEVVQKCPEILQNELTKIYGVSSMVKSATYIHGSLKDNKKLLESNPDYIGSLMALPPDERRMLLEGNWKVSLTGTELGDYNQINLLFKNKIVPKETDLKYITCDPAGWGKDLCVIIVWHGLLITKISIFTKSGTDMIIDEIERLRISDDIPKTRVSVDRDGLGNGVVDVGGYVSFQSGKAPLPVDATLAEQMTGEKEIKENYQNLKTQCFYRLFENYINKGLIGISLDCVKVDGVYTQDVKLKSKMISVETLIKQDLRSIRRGNKISDDKKYINSKEDQKEILGRSPDFGDCISQRCLFDLKTSGHSFSYVG